MVALVIWRGKIQPFCIRTRGFELDGRRIYLLGTGASSFFEYLETHPTILPGQESKMGLSARAILLRFAARASVLQWKRGWGLNDSWGGGFEVAFPHRGVGFAKIGNVLSRAWMIDRGGNIHNSGRSFFSRYYGEDLHLSCLDADEKTYIIPSLIKRHSEIPEFELVHPEWLLDTFVIQSNGAFCEFARFQPPTRPVKDAVRLAHGAVVGWEMDESYVKWCKEKAMASGSMPEGSARGDSFDVIRF